MAPSIGPELGAAVLGLCLQSQADALATVHAALDRIEDAAQRAARCLRGTGRLIYCGSGSSGLMAMADALELAGTFGIAPARTPILFPGGADALLHLTGAPEDNPALAEADFAALKAGPEDLFVCVSASGSTPYSVAMARLARAQGAGVIGIANVPGSPLLAVADCAILLDTGAEAVTGSTRLGAATAQKVALNLFSVRLGILLGHVHAGHMVNLVADNAKLLARSQRIVADIAGCEPQHAEQALTQAGGHVKTAILIALGADARRATDLLHASGGHLAAPIRQLAES